MFFLGQVGKQNPIWNPKIALDYSKFSWLFKDISSEYISFPPLQCKILEPDKPWAITYIGLGTNSVSWLFIIIIQCKISNSNFPNLQT